MKDTSYISSEIWSSYNDALIALIEDRERRYKIVADRDECRELLLQFIESSNYKSAINIDVRELTNMDTVAIDVSEDGCSYKPKFEDMADDLTSALGVNYDLDEAIDKRSIKESSCGSDGRCWRGDLLLSLTSKGPDRYEFVLEYDDGYNVVKAEGDTLGEAITQLEGELLYLVEPDGSEAPEICIDIDDDVLEQIPEDLSAEEFYEALIEDCDDEEYQEILDQLDSNRPYELFDGDIIGEGSVCSSSISGLKEAYTASLKTPEGNIQVEDELYLSLGLFGSEYKFILKCPSQRIIAVGPTLNRTSDTLVDKLEQRAEQDDSTGLNASVQLSADVCRSIAPNMSAGRFYKKTKFFADRKAAQKIEAELFDQGEAALFDGKSVGTYRLVTRWDKYSK